MKPLFKLLVILLNLFILAFLFYQIKARKDAETEISHLRSIIKSIDTEASKIEDGLVGKELPSLSGLTDLHINQNFEVLKFDGKKLVILFSSMSCPTCMDNLRRFWIELPQLAKRKQIKILAIATGTSRSEIKIFIRMHGVEIPVAFDQNVSVTSGLGLSHDAVAVLLVNNKGKIALAHVSASINTTSDREKFFLEKLKNILDLIYDNSFSMTL